MTKIGLTVKEALGVFTESRKKYFKMLNRDCGLLEHSVVDAYLWYAKKESLGVEDFTDIQKKQAWMEYLIMKMDDGSQFNKKCED